MPKPPRVSPTALLPLALNRDGAGPVPVEVLRYWRGKGVRPGFNYQDVWDREHDVAFTAAKIMREDVLDALRGSLDQAVAGGQSFESWRRALRPELERLGFWGSQTVTDPVTGNQVEIDVPRRLHRIFETNMRTARAAGQWERIERTKKSHPYLLYEIGASKEHRPEHVAWHGLCLPVEDPFWETHFPPNGWGCKCHVRQVSQREFERLLRDGIGGPDKVPVIDPETGLPTGHVKRSTIPIRTVAPELELVPWQNARTGETQMVPRGVDPGFARRPTARIDVVPPTESGIAPAPTEPPAPTTPPEAPPSPTPTTRVRFEGQVEPFESHDAMWSDLATHVLDSANLDAAAIRESARRAYQTLDPGGRSFDLIGDTYELDIVEVDPDLERRDGALGTHADTGAMSFDASIWPHLNSGLRALSAGGKLSDAELQAVHTFVHEAGHEHSPAEVGAWDPPLGRRIEEVTNELLARDLLRRAGIYSDAFVARVGAYQELVDALRRGLREHLPGASTWTAQESVEHVISSARRMRDRTTPIQTESDYVDAFLDALEIPTEARATLAGALLATPLR